MVRRALLRTPSIRSFHGLVIVLACLSLVAAGLLTAPLGLRAAHAAGSSGWKNHCPWSHSATDDPIVKPGEPGESHLHDFFGNRSTHAHSTYASMLAASTRCDMPADTGAYWVPALFKDGAKITPSGLMLGDDISNTAYYRDSGTSLAEVPFPADLRVVTGNGHATSAAENPIYGDEIYWQCENGDTTRRAYPADCPSGIVVLKVHFPTCWDGTLTHSNDSSHMRYEHDDSCPAGWKALPELILRLEYPVGTDSSGITLATGPVWTAHADFWNTWHQPTLNTLTSDCLNAQIDCGTDPDMGADPVKDSTPSYPESGPAPTPSSAGGIRLGRIYYNSPGDDDGSNRSLNAEWFVLKNQGSTTRDLSGWTVRDSHGHVYRVRDLRLAGGARVKVHTGSGTSHTIHRYWGRDRYVWDNRGDRATLKNRVGTVVDRCSWRATRSSYIDC